DEVHDAELAGHLAANLNRLLRLGRAHRRDRDRHRFVLNQGRRDRNGAAGTSSAAAAGPAVGPCGLRGAARGADRRIIGLAAAGQRATKNEDRSELKLAWHSKKAEEWSSSVTIFTSRSFTARRQV